MLLSPSPARVLLPSVTRTNRTRLRFGSEAKESFTLSSKNGEVHAFALELMLSPTASQWVCFKRFLSAEGRGRSSRRVGAAALLAASDHSAGTASLQTVGRRHLVLSVACSAFAHGVQSWGVWRSSWFCAGNSNPLGLVQGLCTRPPTGKWNPIKHKWGKSLFFHLDSILFFSGTSEGFAGDIRRYHLLGETL